MEPGSLTIELEGDRVLLEGLVGPQTPDDLSDFIDRHPSATLYSLRHIEGSVDDEANLEAARILRQHGVTTLVESDGLVASGGTDLFLAGTRRVVEAGACIGVHSWADSLGQEGVDLSDDDPQHDMFLDYYAQMGIDDDFYWFTLDAAPAQGMHWMTRAELEAYGVATEFIGRGDADDRHGADCEE
jgi:hypothetical protein